MTATAAIRLDYFYGTEDKMCSFYRIPKAFEKCEAYRNVSLEIKYLYSIMLDRVSVSARNGWLDAGRVFIYFSLSEVVRCIQAGRTKAVQVIHEMEKLGLIQRKKQGQGRPARIFVRNIIEQEAEDMQDTMQDTEDMQGIMENTRDMQGMGDMQDTTEVTGDMETQEIPVQAMPDAKFTETEALPVLEVAAPDTDLDTTGQIADREPVDQTADPTDHADPAHPFGGYCAQMVPPTDTINATGTATDTTAVSPADRPAEPQTFGIRQSRLSDSETLDVQNLNPNYNNKNYTELNYHPSIYPDSPASNFGQDSRIGGGRMERMETRERIHAHIDYPILTLENPEDVPEIDRYVDLMTETLCSGRDTVRINGCLLPMSVVRERLENLDRMHLLYVADCMRRSRKEIVNIRAYLLTALYNAPDTMEAYYDMRVRCDLAGWEQAS